MTKPELAPDGGPVGHPLFRMTQQRYPLLEVTDKETGARLKIRESNYDPSRHSKADASGAPRKRLAALEPEDPGFGTESKDELLTMTLKTLRAKPEFARIKSPSSSKEELVEQILAVREEAKE